MKIKTGKKTLKALAIFAGLGRVKSPQYILREIVGSPEHNAIIA